MMHIGIVACSAEGAALCYQTICREALVLVGKNDHPRITMDSIAMARWIPAFDAGDYAGVARVMLDSARLLASAGADFAIWPRQLGPPGVAGSQRPAPTPPYSEHPDGGQFHRLASKLAAVKSRLARQVQP
jgi:hypothetical protein